jgi:hypothetical protein
MGFCLLPTFLNSPPKIILYMALIFHEVRHKGRYVSSEQAGASRTHLTHNSTSLILEILTLYLLHLLFLGEVGFYHLKSR